MQPYTLHLTNSKHHKHIPTRSPKNRLLIITDYSPVPPIFPTVLLESFWDFRWKTFSSAHRKSSGDTAMCAELRPCWKSNSNLFTGSIAPFPSYCQHCPPHTVASTQPNLCNGGGNIPEHPSHLCLCNFTLYKTRQLALLKPISILLLRNKKAKHNESKLS